VRLRGEDELAELAPVGGSRGRRAGGPRRQPRRRCPRRAAPASPRATTGW